MRALVLGAGIAGLATAHALRREAARNGKPLEITILEASGRPGGRIRTDEDAGHRIEWGANAVQGMDGAASRLVDELGLASERVVARPESARRYIARRGALHLVPLGPASLLRFGALSLGGRLRVLAEPFFARRRAADETVLSFAERHVGREAATTLVGAAVRGIFAGEADRLSLEASFPLMREMERKHRSLVVAMIRRKRSPGRTTLWSLRRGMGSLVDALARSFGPAIRLRSPALTIERTGVPEPAGAGAGLEWAGAGPRWRVRLASGERAEADLLLLATPPKVTAALLRGLDAEAAHALAGISSAGLAVVAMSFRPEVFQRAPDGYGFLVPPGEPLEILGALFETNLWPERAPEGRILIRAMVGGAGRPDLLTRSDAELTGRSMRALDMLLGLKGGPERTWVIRQEEAIPQYAVGHRKVLDDLATRLQALPGIHLAGNAYRGVSVASISEDAERTAVRMAAELR
jgi:oxygen-dependent protoporphyrinogen oxidase